LTYFANGGLPWQSLQANNRSERYNKICEMKLRIPVEQLCYGLPSEFASYINYCRSLRFEDRPDYSHLRKMFKELLVKEGYEYDYAFDWVIMNDKLVNQNVLTMVDNGDDNGESKQSSMVNNDDHDKTGVMQDEEKSEGKPEDKGSNEEGEDRKEGEGVTENSAIKRDDEDGSQVTNGNSLLGGDGGPAESVKKTSIMEKLASQQQKPTKKFLMQGNDGMGDSKDKNILGKKGDKKGAAGAKGKSGGSAGKKKDSGCNNQ
jgi:hypothetical protein